MVYEAISSQDYYNTHFIKEGDKMSIKREQIQEFLNLDSNRDVRSVFKKFLSIVIVRFNDYRKGNQKEILW